MRVLLVEDDVALAEAVASHLRGKGFAVDPVASLASARAALPVADWDAVLLDLHLPDGDGLSLIPLVRRKSAEILIVVLTARDQVSDRIRGLDAGADDYLVKPIDLHELAARLRALVRRSHGQTQNVLVAGTLELDPVAHQVKLAGNVLDIVGREYDLLHVLMRNTGRVLSRAQIEQHLYDWGHEVASNAIEVHIHHLRRKLPPNTIETVRGVGYVVHKGNQGTVA